MLKRKSVWLLLSASLFLSACSSSVSGVEKDRQSAEDKKEGLVVALNGIQQQEIAVQQAFNETLSTDPELASLKDGSAPVFTNIELREEQLQTVKGSLADLTDLQEELGQYDKDELPKVEIADLAASLAEITAVLEPYVAAYESQLQLEAETFRSFSADEADFNTFYEGVKKLNETSKATLESLQPLPSLLAAFDEKAEKLASRLTELQED